MTADAAGVSGETFTRHGREDDDMKLEVKHRERLSIKNNKDTHLTHDQIS